MKTLKDLGSFILGLTILMFCAIVLLKILSFIGISEFKRIDESIFGKKSNNSESVIENKQWDGSFTGNDHNKGKKCNVPVGAGGGYCSCPGCEPKHWDAFSCANCPHKCSDHTR